VVDGPEVHGDVDDEHEISRYGLNPRVAKVSCYVIILPFFSFIRREDVSWKVGIGKVDINSNFNWHLQPRRYPTVMPSHNAYAQKSRFDVLNDMTGDDVESEEEEVEVEQT
jgi:hypothetical protein